MIFVFLCLIYFTSHDNLATFLRDEFFSKHKVKKNILKVKKKKERKKEPRGKQKGKEFGTPETSAGREVSTLGSP